MAARKSPRVAKALRAADAIARRTKRVNWSIDVEVLKRFTVHCAMTEQKSETAFLESLILEACNRFVVHDHGRKLSATAPAETVDRLESDGSVIQSEAA